MKKLLLSALFLTPLLFADTDLATKAKIKDMIDQEAKDLPIRISNDGNMLLAGMQYDIESNILRLTAVLNSKYFAPKEGDLAKLKKIVIEQIAPTQQQQICDDFAMTAMLVSDTLIKYEYMLDNMQEPFYTLNITKKSCGYTGEFQILEGN
mgnify:FL=1